MSVGHLDHVLIVLQLVGARNLVPCVAELVGSCILIHAHRCLPDVESEDQETQERTGLFHSWYIDPSLQGKGEQCNTNQQSQTMPWKRTMSSIGTTFNHR